MAVALGAATTCAVLTGALLVGDSVRGSLADLTLDRLGSIDRALVSTRYLRESLVEALDGPGSAGSEAATAPAIILKGAAVHAASRARAGKINILGVDGRFAALYPPAAAAAGLTLSREPARGEPRVFLNGSLARELGASEGDPILLSFPRASDAPPDSLLGRRDLENVVATMRCRLAGVIPDEGPGLFDLSARQARPRNAYLSLSDLQRALRREGRINALLAAGGASPASDVALKVTQALDLDDMGLLLSRTPDHLSIESREFVLRPEVAEGVESVAASMGASVQRVLTYLAVRMSSSRGSVPYSTITAVSNAGPPFSGLWLEDGSPAPAPKEGEILLDAWAAQDLHAVAGDEVDVTYFVVGEKEDLLTRTALFRVSGIAAMRGLAVDRTLTPDYPGIKGAPDIASWNPPFPVELNRIRPHDEEYWDRYGAAPKAFVSEVDARRLWTSRYGNTTALRVVPPAGTDLQQFAGRLSAGIKRELPPELFGLRFRDVKDEGLRASAGATDFGSLFLAFSFFLIISSVLLCGLLFRLGVESRAREIGVLLASGYRVRAVLGRFLLEGSVIAAAGAGLGLALGVAYAGLLMLGLRTVWKGASGSSHLFLHVSAASLAAGALSSLATVIASIFWALGRLKRIPVPLLLSGHVAAGGGRAPGKISTWIAFGGLASGVVFFLGAVLTGRSSDPALSFGIGASVLASSLAFFARWCRAPGRRRLVRPGRSAFAAMAVRNCSWNPGRSILSAMLIACACFIIVMTAASRRDAEAGPQDRHSGSGGYALVAESDIPLHQDLNTAAGRAEMGFPGEAEPLMRAATVVSFRTVPGDDVSCLNLYRPERPRLLGVAAAQIERGGFAFHGAIADVDNPWTLLRQEIEPGVVPAIGDVNSVQWILHLGLGQDLVVQDEFGRTLRLRFVALLAGSPFQSEVLIPEKALLDHFPSHGGYAAFLIDAPPSLAGEIARVLKSALGAQGLDVETVASRISAFHAVENTYLSTFEALGGLGLLLGTLGLGIVVVRNAIERRGELAVMRAIGFSRPRLTALVFVENVFLLCFGMTAGTASALAAVSPRFISGASGSSWISVGATLAAVLVVGLVSTLIAVRSSLRAPLLPTLKAER